MPNPRTGLGCSGRAVLGARWDEPTQNERLRRAFEDGLIDYIEANYPIARGFEPEVGDDTPVLVHCPVNPLASAHGFNRKLAAQVRAGAEFHDSPWIGEHLCWLSAASEGRLGYIVNPIFCEATRDVAVENVRALSVFYGRPVALELAPVYGMTGSFASEIHFLTSVAEQADALIIFDLAHWTASNRNLGRPPDFGLDVLPRERIVELHIAGIRPSRSTGFWHDSHGDLPEVAMIELVREFVCTLPSLRAVTFEHLDGADEGDLRQTLKALRAAMA
ncbi:MAG: DUF692 family multinuclear iron-containing protein [Myxococcota bacterium]